MTTSSSRRRGALATAVATGALTAVVLAPAAYADGTMTVVPNPVAQNGAFEVTGTDCVDEVGPGIVTVFITYPNGEVLEDGPIVVGEDGTWATAYEPEEDVVAPGQYRVDATCDVYASSFDYDSVSLGVAAIATVPTATASSATVVAGNEIALNVTGFAGSTDLTATLQGSGQVIGTIRTDLYGAAAGTLYIPASVPAGTYTVVITAADGTSATVTITVSAGAPPAILPATNGLSTGTTGKATPSLAVTGAEIGFYGPLAGGLLLAGAGALLLGRRRQNA